MVKSLSGEMWSKLKLKSVVAAQPDSVPSTPRDGVRRGRPTAGVSGQVVSCRLPAEELNAFDVLCTQLGAKSRSDGVRSIVRMASGFLELSREDSVRLKRTCYELRKIGPNVNQIALAVNRVRASMVRVQWASVDELRRSLPSVTKALNQIIAERRRQGFALFLKFADAQERTRHG